MSIFARCLLIIVLIRRSIICAFVENPSSGWFPGECPIWITVGVKSSPWFVRVLIFGIFLDDFVELIYSILLSEYVSVFLYCRLAQSFSLMLWHRMYALEKTRKHLMKMMLQFDQLSLEIRCSLLPIIF